MTTRKVLEAYTRDVGRGVVRLDYKTMDELCVSTGDIIEVIGKKTTVAKVLPLYPSDEDKGFVRLDGLGRDGADVKIQDLVELKKTKWEKCEEYSVYPLEAIPPIDERYLSDALESTPVMVGQRVMIPYFGGRISFLVKKTKPEGAVVITEKSKCTILNEDPDTPKTFKFNDKNKNYTLTLTHKQISQILISFGISNLKGTDEIRKILEEAVESEGSPK